MRLSQALVILLPALSLAEQQSPLVDKLRGWFNKATSYIPASVPTALPDVRDAGAAKIAKVVVHPLNLSNWQSELAPADYPAAPAVQEWLVFITGSNKTCAGLCENVTKAWNTSAALLAATPKSPKLASIDCEREGVLCSLWAVHVPSLYHLIIPRAPVSISSSSPSQPQQIQPHGVTARYIRLNVSSTSATEITEIHSKKNYLRVEPYEGAFHPFNGFIANYGLGLPVGYFLYAMSIMPPWLPMILITFVTRSFSARRLPQGGPGGPASGQAPASAPAPAQGAAK